MAPANAGLSEDARLRGTAVTLAAAVRSGGVTTAMTYDVRVGTSICESAALTSSNASATIKSGENAAAIRKTLDGMWVKTIVLMRPKRFESQAATGYETALKILVQKKKTLAAESDMSKRMKSHSAKSDCTTKPPANASRLNSTASLYTTLREGPSGALGRASSMRACGNCQ